MRQSLNCEDTLSFFSEKDSRFINWKNENELFANFLQTALNSGEFEPWRDRFLHWQFAAKKCATFLGFRTSSEGLKLHEANFCKHRLCPVCARRRSEIWRAKIAEVFSRLSEDTLQDFQENLIFLTLTIRNFPLEHLAFKRRFLSQSFNRLLDNTLRKQGTLRGYLKGFEITKPKDKSLDCHPHYHVLLYVSPKYWENVINQKDWVLEWQKATRSDYGPSVHIRKVSGADGAAFEICKYELKPQNYVENWRWTSNLAIYNYRSKRISTGGWFKEHFSFLKTEPTDLIHEIDRDYQPGGRAAKKIYFTWDSKWRQYIHLKEETYYGESVERDSTSRNCEYGTL